MWKICLTHGWCKFAQMQSKGNRLIKQNDVSFAKIRIKAMKIHLFCCRNLNYGTITVIQLHGLYAIDSLNKFWNLFV